MSIKVILEKFKKHKCEGVANCPVEALTQKDENTPPVVDESKCIDCQLCTTICTNGELVSQE